ncbi:MAG: type II toxin-antitoxin system HicB family antitoxin [Candidatus Levyibacteriota bacterium]
MKQSITKKVLSYTAIFEPAEEGGYIVSIPALPGCVTQGETFEEATEMIKDAMEGYLVVLQEEGEEVPEEKENVIITKVTVANPTPYLA